MNSAENPCCPSLSRRHNKAEKTLPVANAILNRNTECYNVLLAGYFCASFNL